MEKVLQPLNEKAASIIAEHIGEHAAETSRVQGSVDCISCAVCQLGCRLPVCLLQRFRGWGGGVAPAWDAGFAGGVGRSQLILGTFQM
jgi:hypothetical protein